MYKFSFSCGVEDCSWELKTIKFKVKKVKELEPLKSLSSNYVRASIGSKKEKLSKKDLTILKNEYVRVLKRHNNKIKKYIIDELTNDIELNKTFSDKYLSEFLKQRDKRYFKIYDDGVTFSHYPLTQVHDTTQKNYYKHSLVCKTKEGLECFLTFDEKWNNGLKTVSIKDYHNHFHFPNFVGVCTTWYINMYSENKIPNDEEIYHLYEKLELSLRSSTENLLWKLERATKIYNDNEQIINDFIKNY